MQYKTLLIEENIVPNCYSFTIFNHLYKHTIEEKDLGPFSVVFLVLFSLFGGGGEVELHFEAFNLSPIGNNKHEC